MRLGLLAAGAVLVVGCFDPVLPAVMCGPQDQCPDGLTCNLVTRVCGDPTMPEADASTIDAAAGGADATADAEVAALIDRGLVARYFLDEADDGQVPTAARDSAPDPLDLPVSYDASLSWSTRDSLRGLAWDAAGKDGRPGAPIAGTKILTQLDGTTTVTIEVVVQVQDSTSSGSRLFFLGENADNTGVALESDAAGEIAIEAESFRINEYSVDSALTPVVVHAVLDSTQATDVARARLYVDGVELTPSNVDNAIDLGETLTLNTGMELALGNRFDGNRSFVGFLGYAAIYNAAFAPSEISNNAEILKTGHDSP